MRAHGWVAGFVCVWRGVRARACVAGQRGGQPPARAARASSPRPPTHPAPRPPPPPPLLPHHSHQILDHYFGNVCELDLVFGFHKVYCLLDEFVIGGEIQETSKKASGHLEGGVVWGGLCVWREGAGGWGMGCAVLGGPRASVPRAPASCLHRPPLTPPPAPPPPSSRRSSSNASKSLTAWRPSGCCALLLDSCARHDACARPIASPARAPLAAPPAPDPRLLLALTPPVSVLAPRF